MLNWTLVDTNPTQGRTFQRPLTTFEDGFFWYGFLDGSTDNLLHVELRLLNGSRDAHLFSEASITRAWMSTKRRYPLMGAIVQGKGKGFRGLTSSKAEGSVGGNSGTELPTELQFVVREHDLSLLRPHEIVFGQVTSAEEAQQRAVAIVDGPRTLSEELLTRLYVFREADSKGARTDVIHLMPVLAHCAMDEVGSRTVVRCLLDTLARGGRSDAEPPQMPLENRLAMAVEPEPTHLRSLSPVTRRWQRAVGAVIFNLRMAKNQGGHTIPCRLKRSTTYIPTRLGFVSTSLTHAQSAAVIANCRQHKLTLGNAYLPLAQVAMTRVLFRRYLRGDISEEEWTYRRRQPHINTGPISLRPHLDKAWFESGGGGEFVLSLSTYTYRLPFMTLGRTDRRRPVHRERDTEQILSEDGVPPFSELLTFDRFLHRAALIKKQAVAFFSHPLLFEIIRATNLKLMEDARLSALQWVKHLKAGGRDGNLDEDEVLAVTDIPAILAHGGSSLGNMDPIFPLEYPLPPTQALSPYSPVSHPMKSGYVVPPPPSSQLPSGTDMTPTIAAEYPKFHRRPRPGELFLGAITSRGQLSIYVPYDSKLFEEGVVREWVDEVKEAILWYLGQKHQSHRSALGHGDDKGAGRGQGVQSKL